ncbi:MAG: ABC transporter ATP-binding protein [Candidatus Zixiibacteriota bacterium]
MSENTLVLLENVWFAYNSRLVLEDVSLTIGRGEFIWMVGPNGGGKTTLLKLMLGLLKPRRGSVRVLGQTPRQARKGIGYMPQQAYLDPHFPVEVLDVVLMGRLGNSLGPYRRQDKESAARALDQVGLHGTERAPFATLSGGQQRRVLIARALAAEPQLLLLDEPTANLDLAVEEELFELLYRLSEHLTIVMASHDPAFVSQFVERVICVNRTVAIHPTSAIEEGIMNELYGRPVRMVRHDRDQTQRGGHD